MSHDLKSGPSSSRRECPISSRESSVLSRLIQTLYIHTEDVLLVATDAC